MARNLSLLLLKYLVLLVPLKVFINKIYYKRITFRSLYLLYINNKPISSVTLSGTSFKESSAIFRSGFTIKIYKQLRNYIVKIRLGESIYNNSDSSSKNLIEDGLANRIIYKN